MKLFGTPCNKVEEHDFMAACNSLRCPYLGCLSRPKNWKKKETETIRRLYKDN